MPYIPYLPYIPNIPYFPNMPYQTDHTHHTYPPYHTTPPPHHRGGRGTVPHPHHTTGGGGRRSTPPPHHRGGRGTVPHPHHTTGGGGGRSHMGPVYGTHPIWGGEGGGWQGLVHIYTMTVAQCVRNAALRGSPRNRQSWYLANQMGSAPPMVQYSALMQRWDHHGIIFYYDIYIYIWDIDIQHMIYIYIWYIIFLGMYLEYLNYIIMGYIYICIYIYNMMYLEHLNYRWIFFYYDHWYWIGTGKFSLPMIKYKENYFSVPMMVPGLLFRSLNCWTEKDHHKII